MMCFTIRHSTLCTTTPASSAGFLGIDLMESEPKRTLFGVCRFLRTVKSCLVTFVTRHFLLDKTKIGTLTLCISRMWKSNIRAASVTILFIPKKLSCITQSVNIIRRTKLPDLNVNTVTKSFM